MNCNILLLGQTGVGKSSLLNYLAGETLAAAGIASKTGGITRGINKYPVVINNQKCIISDSEGLELTHSDYWQKLIAKELFKKRGHSKISDWYHIVVYCIGANGGRVQDFELDLLAKVVAAGYGTIVAFTKADLATESELDSMQNVIESYFKTTSSIQFIPVCSKRSRGSLLEGREELSNAIIDSWGESICNRLPAYIYDYVFRDMSSWYDSTYDWITKQKIGIFNKSKEEVLDELNRKIQRKQGNLSHSVELRQKKAFKDVAEVYDALSQVIDFETFSLAGSPVAPKIEKLQASFVFEENTASKSLLAVAGTALLLSVPVVGIPLTILNTLWGILDKDKRTRELIAAFNHQYLTLVKLYQERKNVFELLLADQIGYIYAHLELGICYLKGRGVEEDFTKFWEYIQPLSEYIDDVENQYRNGRAEYYIAYMHFACNEKKEGKKWLRMSKEDGYENAIKAYKSSDMFAEMKNIEETEDKQYIASFYDTGA